MKRKITTSIALVLSIVLLSLIKSDTTASAEPPQRFTFDTGVIPIREGQILRVTVLGALDLNDLFFRVNRQSYAPGVCNTDGVCRLAVASESISDPIRLMPGEAVSLDSRRCVWPICGGVRAVVESTNRNAKVNALIIDGDTGDVVSCTDLVLDPFNPNR